MAGRVTQVTLNVMCTVPTDASMPGKVTTGTVEVDAGFNLVSTGPAACPGITSLSISPAELAEGQSAALSLSASAPSSLTWSVSPAGAGTFGQIANGVLNCARSSNCTTCYE